MYNDYLIFHIWKILAVKLIQLWLSMMRRFALTFWRHTRDMHVQAQIYHSYRLKYGSSLDSQFETKCLIKQTINDEEYKALLLLLWTKNHFCFLIFLLFIHFHPLNPLPLQHQFPYTNLANSKAVMLHCHTLSILFCQDFHSDIFWRRPQISAKFLI